MPTFHFIEPREVRDLEGETGELAGELFRDSTSGERFAVIVGQLAQQGFDFNGLHSRGWTIGKTAVLKATYDSISALDMAGYNFAADPDALAFAENRWQGMFYRAVCMAAHKYDRTIEIPSLEREAAIEAAEMETPSLRRLDLGLKLEM